MPLDQLLTVFAGVFALALALGAVVRSKRTAAGWFFAAGMLVFVAECALQLGLQRSTDLSTAIFWAGCALVAKSFFPGVWIGFALTYSRGNYREFLHRNRLLLAASFTIPPGLAILGFQELIRSPGDDAPATAESLLPYGTPGIVLNLLLLAAIVIIFMNLERTFRSAVGTMRWRMKFLMIGLGLIFGARVYVRSQAVLFSGQEMQLIDVEMASLLVGCMFIAFSHLRRGLSEVDVYPSHAALQTSITVILVGGYLLAVGLLGQWVAQVGGTPYFHLQALVILCGMAALAVLLLSERARRWMRTFVSRHFRRPEHDFRRIWTNLTRRLSEAHSPGEISTKAAGLLSETFNALSTSVWLLDDARGVLELKGSTRITRTEGGMIPLDSAAVEALGNAPAAFDLEKETGAWAATLREQCESQFERGGNRLAVPLVADDRVLGLAILGDRVHGIPYSIEELDLLKCVGDQMAASLLNQRLTANLMAAKEMEAFQAMSAFFVHDLKNSASSMNMMLKNLPTHLDDPEFREDAIRGIGKAVTRINQLIERLSAFRNRIELRPRRLDLNALVEEAACTLGARPDVVFVRDLQPVPEIMGDAEHLNSVVTNLLLNAADSVSGGDGRVVISTAADERHAILSVTDNGCGMSPEFLAQSLFRPFQSSKKNGLGIGMFQSKMIVEAHRGRIAVESVPGQGTTFRIMLPLGTSSRT